MDGGETHNRRRLGSVKAAINLYGDKDSVLKKTQMKFSEASPNAREFHRARRDIGRFSDSKRDAESAKARAEQELLNAKITVKNLSSRIEESNSMAKSHVQDLKSPKRGGEEQWWALSTANGNDSDHQHQYEEVMRELEYIKRELTKLKLDMGTVLEEKRQAERETEESRSKITSYSSMVESLTKKIDELNEEQVLVELARIEATKEFGSIEAQRKEESEQYSDSIEKTKKKMNEMIQEIDRAKGMEIELAVANSDIDVLQNKLKLVREMEGEELGSSRSLLDSVEEELMAAKKELASIREEGFQFMASMDIIRDELKHVAEETARLKKTEEKSDSTVQNLNSKLLCAKAKLETAIAAEQRAQLMESNLSLTLQQLKTEKETAMHEKTVITEETEKLRAEVQRIEWEIDLSEDKLQAATQELEAVKSSEAIALENLKTVIENTMRARASASNHSSTITISTFEYEYLTGHGAGAEEIADKKVAAAQAWIEALKASEKEILMKTEIAQRELREQKLAKEQEVYKTETETETFPAEAALNRKSTYRNGNTTPARRAKYRKSASPAGRYMPSSPSINLRRRKKVMPNLGKLFGGKNTGMNA